MLSERVNCQDLVSEISPSVHGGFDSQLLLLFSCHCSVCFLAVRSVSYHATLCYIKLLHSLGSFSTNECWLLESKGFFTNTKDTHGLKDKVHIHGDVQIVGLFAWTDNLILTRFITQSEKK